MAVYLAGAAVHTTHWQSDCCSLDPFEDYDDNSGLSSRVKMAVLAVATVLFDPVQSGFENEINVMDHF